MTALADVLRGRASARTCCPQCGRGDKDRTLGLTHDARGIVAHCFRCNYVATEREEQQGRRTAAPPAPQTFETLTDRWRAFWIECKPLAGTVGETYLEARACVIPPADSDLRFHPSAWHWPTKTQRPALIALLTDATSGAPRSLHFTYLKPDGSAKTDADPPRLLLPRHRKAGAVCRLWPDEAVTEGLCVAEGIETALSAAHAFRPVWAAIDAGNLAALPVLPGIESLVIAADHDDAGVRAADDCGQRWADAGREVRIVKPATAGADLNDMAAA